MRSPQFHTSGKRSIVRDDCTPHICFFLYRCGIDNGFYNLKNDAVIIPFYIVAWFHHLNGALKVLFDFVFSGAIFVTQCHHHFYTVCNQANSGRFPAGFTERVTGVFLCCSNNTLGFNGGYSCATTLCNQVNRECQKMALSTRNKYI